MLPLEDTAEDIIRKAQQGLGIGDETLLERAGIGRDAFRKALACRGDRATYEALARALGLHGASLAAVADGTWHPEPVALDGLCQATTRFGGMTVNAYLVWDPAGRAGAAFDTGSDAGPLFEFSAEQGIELAALFLTHSHGDHIADLGAFARRGLPIFASEEEPVAGARRFPSGQRFDIGGLKVETRLTRGHTPGGITYVVTGLARTVAVAGDALFAGSMGGARCSYPAALATNRAAIFSLPDDSIIAPGHGPLTTVAEEKMRNPFFPEFKPGR
jgi:glyoxylase-like metal-dependent hydrolase (beta-lactamase superfamily II)